MANPRIDDLRKKLEKEPGSRLFAQLAEELRKEGELAEAIRVSRQGLSHHPAVHPEFRRHACHRPDAELMLPAKLLKQIHFGFPIHSKSPGSSRETVG